MLKLFGVEAIGLFFIILILFYLLSKRVIENFAKKKPFGIKKGSPFVEMLFQLRRRVRAVASWLLFRAGSPTVTTTTGANMREGLFAVEGALTAFSCTASENTSRKQNFYYYRHIVLTTLITLQSVALFHFFSAERLCDFNVFVIRLDIVIIMLYNATSTLIAYTSALWSVWSDSYDFC